MSEVILTEKNFESEVLNSDKPVLIDFWASWCGPCQMISPIVAEISSEYSDRIKVCKANVDEEPSLAVKYKIESIPTLILFKNGQIINMTIGYHSKPELVKFLGLYI